MINIAQSEFQQLVRQDAPSIRESKQRMIGEDCAETHCPSVQNGFMAEATQTGMSMHNLDLFSQDDVAEYWKERENGGKCRFTVDDKKRDVIDFETIGKVAYSCTPFIGMGDDDDLMAAVD